jgi:hypothetical protein
MEKISLRELYFLFFVEGISVAITGLSQNILPTSHLSVNNISSLYYNQY